MPRPRRLRFLLVAVLLSSCSLGSTPPVNPGPTADPRSAVPALRHVVVVVLENAGYDTVVGNAGFAQLASQGVLLRRYFGVAHHSLPNYIALTSGARPTAVTRADCTKFNCLVDGPTIASQLEAAGLSWKAYFGASTTPCLTPEPGHSDTFVKGYLTHHNPFAYYPSVGAGPSGGTAACQSHLRPLSELGDDAGSGRLPAFSLVIADSCEDGHDTPCADGRPGGLATAIPWLDRTMATIRGSSSWTPDSLAVATFDEGDDDDSSGCCGDRPGGGHLATILLSGLVSPGATNDSDYDHYSLLRTIEDGLGLHGHLGAAADPQVHSMTDVWARVSPQTGR